MRRLAGRARPGSLHRLSPSSPTLIELSTAVTTPPARLTDAIRLAEKVWYSPKPYRGGDREPRPSPPVKPHSVKAAAATPPQAPVVQPAPPQPESRPPVAAPAPAESPAPQATPSEAPRSAPEPEAEEPDRPAIRTPRLKPGAPVSGRVDADHGAEYEIELAAPAVITFDIVSATALASYSLTAPSGEVIFHEESSDVGPLELSESGIYRLSVEAIAGKVADFELRIAQIR
jgi:hypothetical protein